MDVKNCVHVNVIRQHVAKCILLIVFCRAALYSTVQALARFCRKGTDCLLVFTGFVKNFKKKLNHTISYILEQKHSHWLRGWQCWMWPNPTILNGGSSRAAIKPNSREIIQRYTLKADIYVRYWQSCYTCRVSICRALLKQTVGGSCQNTDKWTASAEKAHLYVCRHVVLKKYQLCQNKLNQILKARQRGNYAQW